MNPNFRLFSPETEAAIAEPSRSHFPAVLEQFKAYLEGQMDETSSDLAEVSRSWKLAGFMDSLPPSILDEHGECVGSEKKLYLVDCTESIDDRYSHLPVIMALAHEGGAITDFVSTRNGSNGINEWQLIRHLTWLSPQQFICASGLLPGRKSNQMYVDFCKQMVEKHSQKIADHCTNGPKDIAQNGKFWFRQMESIVGRKRLLPDGLKLDLPPESLKFLDAPLEDFDSSRYHDLMRNLCPDGNNFFNIRVVDNLFFADAFAMSEKTSDTPKVLKVLAEKARFWAEIINPHVPAHDDFVEQMVACAMFTHPDHFRRAGFGLRNLMGLEPERVMLPLAKYILSGPITFFTQIRHNLGITSEFPPGLARVFAYTQAAFPEMTVESLLEKTGFRNKSCMHLIELEGGHLPIVDSLILDGMADENTRAGLLYMIGQAGSYDKYHPTSLVALLVDKFERIDMPRPDELDGPVPKFRHLYDEDSLEKDRVEVFLPALKANPGLKAALIAYLEDLPQVTPDHLKLTSISAVEAPNVARKMSLVEQGQVFSNDLGL